MPLTTFEKIRDALFADLKQVDLVGYGEPLLARHFDHMLETCLSRDMTISFITNGILLRSDKTVSKLAHHKILIYLSIDGARAETSEFTRPYIKWEKMIETLECLRRNADATDPENRFTSAFSFVGMRHNIGDLPDMVRLAAKYGVRIVNVAPVHEENMPENEREHSLDGAPDLVSPPYFQAVKLARHLGVELHIPPFFRQMIVQGPERGRGLRGKLLPVYRRAFLGGIYLQECGVAAIVEKLRRVLGARPKVGRSFCLRPWKDAYFYSDGMVSPCCLGTENLGNISTQEWGEIWNGSLYRNFRRLIHGWNPPRLCRYCALAEGVNGGDERLYTKFFAKYRFESVSLDSPSIEFGEGFHELERFEDRRVSHRWMGQTGLLSLPMPKKARFLRFNIIPRSPILPDTNPGRCRINGGPWEPFDNTCPDITFPLGHVREERLRIEIEMENAPQAPGDPRHLGLAISGIHFLFPR
jgi:MoaA/NifB/PqqE/SkfB family radical SAM enzyme